ncbi:hypothetical protein ADL27_38355 [Streptomyces sp. NRRL F-6602]|nr:hypothetical protein ADL27_38355 [Streptomyces sp. NRRL F-6602]
MSLLAQLMTETWDIERPGEMVRDSTGSYVPGPPVRIPVTRCAVATPYGVTVGSSSEQNEGQSTVTTRRVLFAPVGTDVRPTDHIVRGDERYEVVGRPVVLPLTSLAHVEAQLQEVTG